MEKDGWHDAVPEAFRGQSIVPNPTLILACIVYWQAKEIGRVITECNPEEDGMDVSLLEHVSPIEWDNVVLYGEYVIEHSWIR